MFPQYNIIMYGYVANDLPVISRVAASCGEAHSQIVYKKAYQSQVKAKSGKPFQGIEKVSRTLSVSFVFRLETCLDGL